MVGSIEEYKETGRPSGSHQVKKKTSGHTHTHTPTSEWYGWEVDASRDVQVIDDRVSMNWN